MGGRRFLAGGLILLVAVSARVVAPGTSLFGWDQARDVAAAREILAGRPLLRGPTVGVSDLHLGPLYYYAAALGLGPRDRPRDVRILLGLLAGVGTFLWYLVFRRLVPAQPAWAAALLLALYPPALIVERIFWNPAVLPPALAVFSLGLLGRWRSPEGRGLGLALVGAALTLHAHLTALFLFPLLFLSPPRVGPGSRRELFWGLLGAAALTIPWAVPEGLKLLRRGLTPGRLFGGPFGAAAAGAPLPAPAALLRALSPEPLAAALLAEGGARAAAWARAGGWVFTGLVLLGLAAAARELRRRPFLLLAGTALAPPLVLVLAVPYNVYFHYLEATFPARCLLAVLGARALAGRIAGGWGAGVVLGVAVLPGVLHWTAATVAEVRTGLVAWRPQGLDCRFRAPPAAPAVRLPTLAARAAVARRLVAAWGITPTDLARDGCGPWWPAFLHDAGFWLREARRRGVTPGMRPPGGRLVLLHRGDPGPRPPPEQVLGHYRVGAFHLYWLRTVLDAPWAFQWPGKTPPGVWVPLAPWVPRRPLPTGPLGVKRLRLRCRLAVAAPPPRRLHLFLSEHASFRWEEVRAAGRPLRRLGSGPAGPGYPFVHWVWERPRAGAPFLELAVRARGPRANVNLDLYDLWER